MKNIIENQKGIAALLIVIILTASTLIMAYNASLFGLGEIELGFTSQKGGEALALAEACMEESMRRIKIDSEFGVGAGDINLLFGTNSCIINISKNLNDRTIITSGKVGRFNKKIQTIITLSGVNSDIITINAWEEKMD